MTVTQAIRPIHSNNETEATKPAAKPTSNHQINGGVSDLQSATHAPAPSSSTATLSSSSSLVAQAASAPDVRTDKVAALQQSIASGSYHVPAHEVAGKIIDSLLG